MLAVQAEGADVLTIEGVADGEALHPMQAAFKEHHALQCGFCTPGMVMCALDLVKRNGSPSEAEIRAYLEGNLCRCTGYHNIVKRHRRRRRCDGGLGGGNGQGHGNPACTRRVAHFVRCMAGGKWCRVA